LKSRCSCRLLNRAPPTCGEDSQLETIYCSRHWREGRLPRREPRGCNSDRAVRNSPPPRPPPNAVLAHRGPEHRGACRNTSRACAHQNFTAAPAPYLPVLFEPPQSSAVPIIDHGAASILLRPPCPSSPRFDGLRQKGLVECSPSGPRRESSMSDLSSPSLMCIRRELHLSTVMKVAGCKAMPVPGSLANIGLYLPAKCLFGQRLLRPAAPLLLSNTLVYITVFALW